MDMENEFKALMQEAETLIGNTLPTSETEHSASLPYALPSAIDNIFREVAKNDQLIDTMLQAISYGSEFKIKALVSEFNNRALGGEPVCKLSNYDLLNGEELNNSPDLQILNTFYSLVIERQQFIVAAVDYLMDKPEDDALDYFNQTAQTTSALISYFRDELTIRGAQNFETDDWLEPYKLTAQHIADSAAEHRLLRAFESITLRNSDSFEIDLQHPRKPTSVTLATLTEEGPTLVEVEFEGEARSIISKDFPSSAAALYHQIRETLVTHSCLPAKFWTQAALNTAVAEDSRTEEIVFDPEEEIWEEASISRSLVSEAFWGDFVDSPDKINDGSGFIETPSSLEDRALFDMAENDGFSYADSAAVENTAEKWC